jgi:hypothetical protein
MAGPVCAYLPAFHDHVYMTTPRDIPAINST